MPPVTAEDRVRLALRDASGAAKNLRGLCLPQERSIAHYWELSRPWLWELLQEFERSDYKHDDPTSPLSVQN